MIHKVSMVFMIFIMAETKLWYLAKAWNEHRCGMTQRSHEICNELMSVNVRSRGSPRQNIFKQEISRKLAPRVFLTKEAEFFAPSV
jgi:hypothetical protein